MDLSVIDAITNFGALGLVIPLILTGFLVPKPYYAKLEEENRLLREQGGLDKQRGDEATEAGRVTGQLIHALTEVVAENREIAHQAHGTTEPVIAGGDAKPPVAGRGLDREDTS